jgi:hypothetical protein
MRLLLALLAILGLLASPVSAAAAQLACGQMTASMSASSMSGADASAMAGMQQDGGVKTAGYSCCDHHGKGCPTKSCARLCAAACAVSHALAAPVVSVPILMAAADQASAPAASVHPFEPGRAERPPTPIA